MFVVGVKVIPSSGVNRIVGVKNGELIVKVKAPAERGKANKELIKYLSSIFKVPKADVIIISGEKSHHKRIQFPDNVKGIVGKFLAE